MGARLNQGIRGGVLGAVLLLAAAACGGGAGGGGGALPFERVAAAAERTTGAGTARMELVQVMEADGEEATLTSTGEVDFARGAMRMEMDLSQVPGADQLPSGQRMEMIYDGEVFYMRSPDPSLTQGWLKFDPAAMEGMGDAMQLNQLRRSDPTDVLQLLQGVSDEVEEVGEEEVRGVPTTRYRALVDLERAMADAPPDLQERMRGQFAQAGLDQVPTEVWIDEDGLLRRQVVEIDMSGFEPSPGAGQPAGAPALGMMTMTLELFEFGVEVDISPPDGEEVIDVGEMMRQQQGGAPGVPGMGPGEPGMGPGEPGMGAGEPGMGAGEPAATPAG
jgi:hypothetical protein